MQRRGFPSAVLFALLAAWTLSAQALVPVPRLAARVTDQTGTLSADQRQYLEQRLRLFEETKGSQVALLIVPTTAPEEIEQYGIRVAEAWKLGREKVDDGALLLVAKDDRALRIEVGYGLEGVLPDAIAKRIIEELIVPRFKQGDFYGGITVGLERIMKTIEGEPLPPPARRPSRVLNNPDLIIVGLFLMVGLGSILRGIFGRLGGASIGSAVAAALVWFVVGSLIVVGFAALVVFLLLLLDSGSRRGGGGRHYGGGGFSGGGFGGGGFSGGGGGFGGGGASGRW